MATFHGKWGKGIRLVMTSRPDDATKRKLKPITGASIDVDHADNRKDIRDFVERALLSRAFESKHEPWRASTANTICEKAGGVFMFAREVLRQLEDSPEMDLGKVPSGLAELYMHRYESTFPEDEDMVAFKAHTKPML